MWSPGHATGLARRHRSSEILWCIFSRTALLAVVAVPSKFCPGHGLRITNFGFLHLAFWPLPNFAPLVVRVWMAKVLSFSQICSEFPSWKASWKLFSHTRWALDWIDISSSLPSTYKPSSSRRAGWIKTWPRWKTRSHWKVARSGACCLPSV